MTALDNRGPVDQFVYDSSLADLESPSIRLIVLWPKGNNDDEIHCSLSEHFISDCPPYETLSYTWGDQQSKINIICDGYRLSITSSLHQILTYLRSDEERLLWIDQISINQDDDVEKGQQVSMMRDIYKRSAQTIAWLGLSSSTEKCFRVMHELATTGIQAFNSTVDNPWHELDLSSNSYMEEVAKNPVKYWGIDIPDRLDLQGVYVTLASPWFTRMWIIQEATVPKHLILQSGSRTITIDHFLFAFVIIGTMTWTSRRNTQVLARGGMEMLNTLAACRYTYQQYNVDDLNIVNLILQCHKFQATDQRDRLFALYGLTSSPLAELGLTIDYTQDIRQTLSSSYVGLIRSDQSLRLLELCESSKEGPFPSWVPTQRIHGDPNLYPLSSLRRGQKLNEDWFFAKCCANIIVEDEEPSDLKVSAAVFEGLAQERLQQTRIEKLESRHPTSDLDIELLENCVLLVKGQFLDRITEVSPIAVKFSPDGKSFFQGLDDIEEPETTAETFAAVGEGSGVTARFLAEQMSGWREVIGSLTSIDIMAMSKTQTASYSSEKDVLTAYRNTVCAGALTPSPGKDLNEWNMTIQDGVEGFDRWRATMKSSVQINNFKKKLGLKGSAGGTSLVMTSVRAHADYDVKSKLILGNAMGPLFGRRLAWTARGRLALVPARAVVGDFVFALKGGEMPYVLRQYEGNWKLLGPTYVDGMMNGELQDEHATGLIRLV